MIKKIFASTVLAMLLGTSSMVWAGSNSSDSSDSQGGCVDCGETPEYQVPEPSTLVMLLTGLALVGAGRAYHARRK